MGAEVEVNGIKYPRFIEVPEETVSILGDRWHVKEMVYQSGKMKGKVYTRWISKDGKYKDVLSANKAVELDCETTGVDVELAKEQLQENRKMRAELQAVENKKKQEASGIVKGAAREESIAYFQDQFAPLNGPVVQAFPSWTTNWAFQPNCGQVCVTYIEPGGKNSWKLLKDLEASLGYRLRNGTEEEIENIKETLDHGFAKADKATFAEGAANARSSGTEFTYTQPGCEANEKVASVKKRAAEVPLEFTVLKAGPAQGDRSEVKRRRRHSAAATVVATEDDYVDCKDLLIRQLPLEKAACEAGLKEAGIGENTAETLAEQGLELRARLSRRGFAEENELMVVCDCSTLGDDATPRPPMLSRLCGFYFLKDGTMGDRPCYQKVLTAEQGVGLVCDGLYLWWDPDRVRWKLGSPLNFCKAGFAYQPGDRPTPVSAASDGGDSAPCWRLLRGDFPGLAPPDQV